MWVETKTLSGLPVLINLDQVTCILPRPAVNNAAGAIVSFSGAEDNHITVAATVDDFKSLASRFLKLPEIPPASKV